MTGNRQNRRRNWTKQTKCVIFLVEVSLQSLTYVRRLAKGRNHMLSIDELKGVRAIGYNIAKMLDEKKMKNWMS